MRQPPRTAPFLTLDSFLEEADQFRLGRLPTEQPHPKTRGLADLADHDLPGAVAVLREVDLDALAVLGERASEIERLAAEIADTFADGARVYLCGCGATGRLALSLEWMWRQLHPDPPQVGRVLSLMAGGDLALVRSIEGFEDHPEFGARHLSELGFGADDLLVACTEGGETPYVIGAAERAAELSCRPPWFLYCNPDSALAVVERSNRVIASPAIRKLSIPTGPMALSGSTRMQATTVLMLAVGYALLGHDGTVAAALDRFSAWLKAADLAWLPELIERESAGYLAGDRFLYETDSHAISVLTDTTERSPTFNLTPFEHTGDPDQSGEGHSLCYLRIPGAGDALEAWRWLLGRPPRPLDWEGFETVAGSERLAGFDFSAAALEHRQARVPTATHRRLVVSRVADALRFELDDLRVGLDVGGLSLLEEHVALKLALNTHSTLVMGRLHRYRSNVMTWVRPSNRKLIDRAIRYIDELLRIEDGVELPYRELAARCFEQMASLGTDTSIVLETVAAIRRSLGSG